MQPFPENIPKLKYDGKLIIFSSVYQWICYANYVNSLVKTVAVLDAFGVRWDYWQHTGDFHIERAVNGNLTRFMNDPDATDFLMLDVDEGWEPQDVVRLLMHDEEVVAGTYRQKNKWHEYNGVLSLKDGRPQGKPLTDGSVLLLAERVPGGFLRIKKSALLKFAAAYPDLRSKEDCEVVTFFERIKERGEGETIPQVYSQDMAFSWRWRQMGERLWIDPMLKIRHGGFTEYPGDLDAHLRGKSEFEKAVSTIQGMAAEIQQRAAGTAA